MSQDGLALAAKRCLDLAATALLLLPALPILALLAVLVRLSSPGPAIFRQTRLGRHRRPFTCYKLRTMTHGADVEPHRRYVAELMRAEPTAGGGLYKLTDDPRITPLGRFLRASSLDELPQLWNVLRGEMSLVGPRPVVPYEVEHYRPQDLVRFEVLPGLTGLWQVRGRSRHGYRAMLELDAEYVHSWSPWLDLGILAATLGALLRSSSEAR